MNKFQLFVQIIGFIGTAMSIISYLQKKRKNILIFQLLCNVSFTIHFFLLGALSGSLMNVMGLIRSIVYTNDDKKWAQSKVWMIFIYLGVIAALIVSWDGYKSLLPFFSMCVSTYYYSIKKERTIRIMSLLNSPCWLIYNIICGSMGGILTEVFSLCAIFTAIYLYDVKPMFKNRKKNSCNL